MDSDQALLLLCCFLPMEELDLLQAGIERAPGAAQLWACCKSHKLKALRALLKEMPFLSILSQAGRACETPEQVMAEA